MTKWSSPLEESYFRWISEEIGRRDLHNTLVLLHRTPFEVLVPYDINRALDGIDLRDEFLYWNPSLIDHRDAKWWIEHDCSVLEMLFALSGRLSLQAGGTRAEWFDHLMSNLGLPAPSRIAKDIIDRFNYREYEPNGGGGLFPLKNPPEDQRDIELWEQMSRYVIENYYGEEV